jgi:protocatechuate 3,4-dioxygenase alpha subunit
VSLPRTPSQTVGPFFEFGLSSRPHQADLVSAGSAGAIRIEGRVLDSADAAVPDGLVEIWQADAQGRYDSGWGWGRCATDADGHFAFTTVKPGAVREPDGSTQAPHVTMLCFARGLLKPVLTRIYFPDEAEANADDRILRAIGESERATLIAGQRGAGTYRFDVKLQGDDQTVFFTTPASGL